MNWKILHFYEERVLIFWKRGTNRNLSKKNLKNDIISLIKIFLEIVVTEKVGSDNNKCFFEEII